MCIIRLGILRAVRFYRTATIVELRTILRDTERRRIVLDADGPLTCVEWTLILRSLGWTPCVSLYFLTVTSFFPFEFLVICATLGFMEADKFFSFFSIKPNFIVIALITFPFVEIDRNFKFGIVGGNHVQIPRYTDISFQEITWESTTLQEVYAIFEHANWTSFKSRQVEPLRAGFSVDGQQRVPEKFTWKHRNTSYILPAPFRPALFTHIPRYSRVTILFTSLRRACTNLSPQICMRTWTLR